MDALPVLKMLEIHKSYFGAKALRGVDWELFPGEIHALCGENGAGKSTLVETLAGTIRPDSGRILLDGREIYLPSPASALKLGIAVIHQELQLVGCLSVAENILLGDEPVRLGKLNRRAIRSHAAISLEMLDAKQIPLSVAADTLPTGQRQIVEIARALRRQARVLILDEPTAALTSGEAKHLADLLKSLKNKGLAIALVSHHLDEVLALSDRLTVLRDGERVGTWQRHEMDHEKLVQAMIGRRVTTGANRGGKLLENGSRSEILTADDISGVTLSSVSLKIRNGEILGMTGLAGAGQEEMAQILAGESVATSGRMTYEGQAYRPVHPAQAQKIGVVAVPADRRKRGLIAALGLGRNLVFQRLRQKNRFGFLNWPFFWKEADRLCEDFQIKFDRLSQNPLTLSGGNQQKALLARALSTKPKLAILNEPTRGVDIRTREAIHQRIEALSASGVAVVVISPDTQELERISDRVVVFRQGQVQCELTGDQISERRILAETAGVAT